ncbi:sugar ABC transporter substrate-binding protein [Clostridium intestinale]|uniref:Monosaccharide-transporting ATPase n=1 Tax=Clostridium intestinale URNW TaxID=1294142 RepID=U2N7S7_9CLOT|nr:substrate-binding domain-containing protein [Clostridium intestinale]ERK31537.1 monosaccharide-transporting ATPase [Clostridium intestinale URNW]
MYVSIPDVFYVPVRHLLNNENLFTLAQNSPRQILIGVSLPNQREDRWIMDATAMKKEADSQGATLKIEYFDFDPVKQTQQVAEMIKERVSIIIIVPIDEESTKKLVEDAHAVGIKVISYEAIAINSDINFFIGFNNIRVGELQGRYLTTYVPKGNYILLSGSPKGELFKEGAMEYITPLVLNRSVKIIADKVIEGWIPIDAYTIVSDILNNVTDKIDGVLAPNDATAGAVIAALNEHGLAGITAVTGQDADLAAIKRIVYGTQLMTVFKDSRELAKTAVDTAIKLVNGSVIDVTNDINNGLKNIPSILVNPIAVDKSNIDKTLVDTGIYKKDEIFKRLN